MIMINSHWIFF